MNISFIYKIIDKYFQVSDEILPEKITPFIYSGENHTLVFIYLNDSPQPTFLLKINKNSEHSFFDNEVNALKLLKHGKLKEFISPILMIDEYCGLKLFLTKFNTHDEICIKTLQSKTCNLKMLEFFKALFKQVPDEKTITNYFYQDAIDATYDLFAKSGKIDELGNISQHYFSYLHHGDLTVQNILWTKNISNPIIIDWEYSSKGWPFFDILHYYYYLSNIFDAKTIIKRKDIMKNVLAIIEKINENKFTKIQIDFFIFTSLYSYLLKFGNDANFLSEALEEIADSYFN